MAIFDKKKSPQKQAPKVEAPKVEAPKADLSLEGVLKRIVSESHHHKLVSGEASDLLNKHLKKICESDQNLKISGTHLHNALQNIKEHLVGIK